MGSQHESSLVLLPTSPVVAASASGSSPVQSVEVGPNLLTRDGVILRQTLLGPPSPGAFTRPSSAPASLTLPPPVSDLPAPRELTFEDLGDDLAPEGSLMAAQSPNLCPLDPEKEVESEAGIFEPPPALQRLRGRSNRAAYIVWRRRSSARHALVSGTPSPLATLLARSTETPAASPVSRPTTGPPSVTSSTAASVASPDSQPHTPLFSQAVAAAAWR